MKKEILQMTPVRFLDFWKVEGKMPCSSITVMGITGIYKLDRISSFVWLYLDGSHTVDSIIAEICSYYTDVKRTQIEQDVITLLKRFDTDDLIILDYNPLHPYKKLVTVAKR
jgi:hypothetical protein